MARDTDFLLYKGYFRSNFIGEEKKIPVNIKEISKY